MTARSCSFLSATALACMLFAGPAVAFDGVVASIKPVHSLVAAVMEGVGTPQLLVKGASSPHAYSMRPSEAAMLERAEVVFWVGEGVETFLEKPLETLAGNARVVTLTEAPGISLLDVRQGGAFESHSHDHPPADHDHGHDGDHAHHDDHVHGEDHAHDHDDDHGHAHDSDDGHHHAHGKDMHIWLDPENARLMVRQIASVLSEADPDNAEAYSENAAALDARFDDLIAETETGIADVRGRPFIVFHDAYHYFERRFDIPATGSVTVSPEQTPGAQRLGEIRAKISEIDATCVFAEPQFEPRLIQVVTEGTSARPGVLDPLGADLEDGPELYFTLMENLAGSLSGCLSGEG